jgi:hypothetical protein
MHAIITYCMHECEVPERDAMRARVMIPRESLGLRCGLLCPALGKKAVLSFSNLAH